MAPNEFEEIVQCLRDGIVILSPDLKITYSNDTARDMLNFGENVLNQQIQKFLPNIDQALNSHESSTFIRTTDATTEIEVYVLKKTAHQTLLQLHYPHQYSVNLLEAERIIRSHYFAKIGTWEWLVNNDELYWSDAIFSMFGFELNEVKPSYELFCKMVHDDDKQKVKEGEDRCLATGENHDEEYRIIWMDGTERWLRETGNLIHDANGKPFKMIGVVRDITEEKLRQKSLERKALNDPLTGLWNRAAFEHRLREALASAQQKHRKVVITFIDLNNFKKVNDNYGHLVGDQVLAAVADRLCASIQNADMITRIGGDEFVILSKPLKDGHSAHEYIQKVSEQIHLAVEKPIELEGIQHQIGASVGAAIYPDHATGSDALIHVADLAMYQAKQRGIKSVAIAQPLSLPESTNM